MNQFKFLFFVALLSAIAFSGYLFIRQLADKNQNAGTMVYALLANQSSALNYQQIEIKNLAREIEDLKNKFAGWRTKTTVKEIPMPKSEPNNASIISAWRPRVSYIECIWQSPDTGQVRTKITGSGLAMKSSDGIKTIIFTNKHVLSDGKGNGPNACLVQLPDSTKAYEVSANNIAWSAKGADWGYLEINSPDDHLVKLVNQNLNYCKKKALVGEMLVILGYPGIGSQTDITATEGIISGYDGNYYITSAKVEHGNSGGAAILLKDRCYLGIPTFTEKGHIESLARILDINSIFNSQ